MYKLNSVPSMKAATVELALVFSLLPRPYDQNTHLNKSNIEEDVTSWKGLTSRQVGV